VYKRQISAAQISRSPDSQAGDALKRVTGLMVENGGYVNVRGMPDRYNVTVIDGALATSVDPDLDRKSFNFEMIPANLLSSLQVLKTALPDMPGDFTGGYVKVNTVEFPERATTSVSIESGVEQSAAGATFYRDAYSGGTDWLGIDDGGRDRPGEVIDAGPLPNDGIAYPDAVGRALPNRWGTETVETPLPISLSLAHGDLFRPFGRKLGVVGAVSFKTKSQIYDGYKSDDPTDNFFEYSDYLSEINAGALLNLNLELADRQTLSFKNLLGRNTEESFLAAYKQGNQYSYRHVLEWEEKQQLTSSLSGEHALPLGGLELGWRVYYNENRAKEPDLRYLEYHLETEPISMLTNRRHWLYVDEFRRGADGRLSWVLGDVDRPTRLSAGVTFSDRERGLRNSPYHVARDGVSGGLVFLPPEEIFAPENFKEGLFTLRYQDQFEGSYDGTQALNAYYAMVDLPFSVGLEELRLAGGARVENNKMAVDAYDKALETFTSASFNSTRVLPSANLSYEYDERTNLRLAFYQSENYPELRECAPVKSNDVKNDWEVQGNAELEVARIDNYDLRAEFFPRFGEVFAVSFFYKDLTNAIETSLNSQPNYLDLLSWFNGDGHNYGIELEMRTRLDFLGRALRDLTLAGNYTRVWSEVEFFTLENPDDEGQSARFRQSTRPLQGQAPWVLNLSLKWESLRLGTSAAVLYNRIGRRLVSVAEDPAFNVYEEPRHLLDAAITQEIGENLSLKFKAKNILGEWRHSVFDVDQGPGTREPQVLPYGYQSDRPTYKLGLTYRF
jgi:outer membrane receptor protein involved in Fe transport